MSLAMFKETWEKASTYDDMFHAVEKLDLAEARKLLKALEFVKEYVGITMRDEALVRNIRAYVKVKKDSSRAGAHAQVREILKYNRM